MITKRGFHQTEAHVDGRRSYHQIGLVRGQFGNQAMEHWLAFIQCGRPDLKLEDMLTLKNTGFDGFEAAGWELKLNRCDTDDEAAQYAKELVLQAQSYGLVIFTVAAHLQGQALGDEPSAKTLQFVGGQAVEMYDAWRDAGNLPPETDPYYVPPDIGAQIHRQAKTDLIRIVRLAHFLGKLQNRQVPVSGFVGSPANRWGHWFGFPPLPKVIGKHPIPNIHQISGRLLTKRFTPVWEACQHYGVKFGLECHPSEFAMGDLASAREFRKLVCEAGFGDVVGFNLDASHMEWQGVSAVEFIREFAECIWSVHLKGVWKARGYSRNGLLGGHQPMDDPDNGWLFVTAGSDRDAVAEEELIIELNRVGFDGALSIEWEDNDVEDVFGAASALKRIRGMDLPPSGKRHDETLKA